jgi:hypothetical protein
MATCGIPFRIRRGTKTQLDSYGPLADGEMGLTLDECKVYIGCNGNNVIVGSTISGSTDPSTPRSAGLLYINTTTSGMFFSTGTDWIPVGASSFSELTGTLDDIPDGTQFQRVAASEVDASGYVIQINDGSNTVTASQARSHIDDATIHRTINDSGSASTDLWSAQKILDELGATVRGIAWQDPVLDKDLCDPPVGPGDGDRYVICSTASGVWASYSNQIVEYITASGGWVYSDPSEGWATWVEDEDRLYLYNGTIWTPISSVTQHDYLAGLSGDGPEYYHLTAAQFTSLTSGLDETVQDIVGPMVSGTQTNIAVTYDDGSGLISL